MKILALDSYHQKTSYKANKTKKMNLNSKQKISETLHIETELLRKYVASFRPIMLPIYSIRMYRPKKNFFLRIQDSLVTYFLF